MIAHTGPSFTPYLRRQVLAALRIMRTRLRELTIVLVGRREMIELHQRFLSGRSVTDVLAFPLEFDSRGRVVEGQIVICVPVARRRSREMRVSLRDELLLYALHGMLHLSGEDDRTHREFERMHRMEDRILARLGVGPVFSTRQQAPLGRGAPTRSSDQGGCMTETWLTLAALLVAVVISLVFSTLTYSLREVSRARLTTELEKRGLHAWIDSTFNHLSDFVFVTATFRLLGNLLVLIAVLHLLYMAGFEEHPQYALAVLITGCITLLVSVAIPHALSTHASERLIAISLRFLHAIRIAMLPLTRLMHAIDRTVARAIGVPAQQAHEQMEQQIEQELLSVVEEGAKEGVVDPAEREMIESVIEFRNTAVAHSMTARGEIIALPLTASLDQIKSVIEEAGHSRIPVYDGDLDHIVGVLYARDLLKFVGESTERFDIRSAMRPAFFVPTSKRLRDLLNDFRVQKVHIAIVLDEYGGTAGLVTIEDVLEELVGEISDEHEPAEPAMLRRLNDQTAEADARMYIDQVNRLLGLDLPEDAGYETLGGFVSNTLGRIPQSGTTFEHGRARYTILEAEPQRVKRVKIELLPQTVGNVTQSR